MANSWLRLWHDMPNDPKWRTIARASKQPITAVIAVYIHLLVNASNASERGRTQNIRSEDLASALDLESEQVDEILSAMQGRVLDGDHITGWSQRQVEREDGSAERAKRWREAKKAEKQTEANATERKQTPDKDKDKECTDTDVSVVGSKSLPTCPHQEIVDLYSELLPELPQVRVWNGQRQKDLAARWKWVLEDLKRRGKPCGREDAVDFFRRMFEYVSKLDFLMGRSSDWSASLGWIVKAENFAKIIEGNYDNKEAA